jgi:predicted DnaQ family exonuclease/DinG family helicase
VDLVAFDLETTGLSPKTDRIIELGAVRFDDKGTVLGEINILVDPQMPVPLGVQRLTGLTDDDLRDQVTSTEAVAQLADFSEGATLVAHGAQFDMAYCLKLAPDAFASRPVLDTLSIARIVAPAAPSHGLSNLAKVLGFVHERPHRALPDAAATAKLLIHLAQMAGDLPAETLERCRRLVERTSGPLGTFFHDLTAGSGSSRPPRPVGAVPELRMAAPDRPAAGAEPQELNFAARAADLLSPGGPLSESPHYEFRESQIEMAQATAQALQRGHTVMIEAPTGVGKSMAYLAPLMLWSAETNRRAVVATHTINLQEQLANNDAARINAVLGEPVQVAVLKGRNHYLSLRRWERFLGRIAQNGGSPFEIQFALKILVWLAGTDTGDRGELRLGANESELWRQIRSDSDDCLGAACANWRAATCPMVAARQRASQANVVITNHALVVNDAERQGSVLERYDALVIDEAHRLEESAAQQMGSRWRYVDINVVLDGLPPSLLASDRADDAIEANKRLFGDIKGLLSARSEEQRRSALAIDEELRADKGFETVARSANHAFLVWEKLCDALDAIPAADPEFPNGRISSSALRDACKDLREIFGASQAGFVSWIALQAEQSEIHSAPIDVSQELRYGLFAQAPTTVLTSATLQTHGSFDFIRTRLGVPAGAAELTLTSEFDYLSQALCAVPTDMPGYDEPAYDQFLAHTVIDCAGRLGGRTLALFTGYGALRRVSALIEERLAPQGIAVLAQGIDGTRRQLLESFVANERTVLCGTSSFWEGIDVPGDALQCVVIAKLPFPVPTDPVVAARCAELTDPFSQYVLPVAVLRLRQGFGRLIRRRSDRGAVVLCDSRLRNRSYARAFLESLPPSSFAQASVSQIGEAVERFVVKGENPESAAIGPNARQSQQSWQQDQNSDEPA